MSTMKAKRQTSVVRTSRMKKTRRYLAEWEGAWKCEVTAMMNMTRQRKAATG